MARHSQEGRGVKSVAEGQEKRAKTWRKCKIVEPVASGAFYAPSNER